MAARFWVGGTGNWDASTTTHWSASSGGSGGQSVPTSADDVTFDSNSGATATVTITASANANTITINKSDLTLTHSAGSTVVGTVTLTTGALNTNGQTCSWGSFSSSNSNTRTLTLGASAITITFAGTVPIASSLPAWDTTTTTGLTFNANTSIITFGATGSSGGASIMNAGNLTYNSVTFAVTGTFQFSYLNGNSPTFANLTVTGQATTSAVFSLGTNITVTTALTMNGSNANTNRLLVNSTVIGTAHTITNNGATTTLTNLDLQDITGAGTASWNLSAITGNSGDCLGNSGITFTTARTLFWVGNTSGWSTANKWSLTSGGTANQSNPLPQDTITFDSHSFSTTGQTVTCGMPRMGKSVDFTNATNSPTLAMSVGAPQAARVFGSMTFINAMSQSGTTFFQFENRDSSTFTTGNNTFTNGLRVNAPGGTVTLSGDFNTTLAAGGLALLAGTFTATSNNLTSKAFVSTGSLTRTLNMGSGTWTVSNTSGFPWNLAGSGLTINANTSTIVVSDTGSTVKTFGGLSGFTYNVLTITGDNIVISGSTTFNTLNINNAGQPNGLKIAQGSTQTITNTLTTNGSAGNLAILASSSSGTAATLSKASGTISVDYLSIKDSHAVGGAKWYAGAHSTNVSNNTGWIFESPPNPTIGWGIPLQ